MFMFGLTFHQVSLARLDLSDTDLPSLTAALEKLLQHLRDEAGGTWRRSKDGWLVVTGTFSMG